MNFYDLKDKAAQGVVTVDDLIPYIKTIVRTHKPNVYSTMSYEAHEVLEILLPVLRSVDALIHEKDAEIERLKQINRG